VVLCGRRDNRPSIQQGTYDIIIYDLGGEVPRETLAKHLNPGGKILPEKD
jgi:protein-L-isoaspartate O-methyltransferase